MNNKKDVKGNPQKLISDFLIDYSERIDEANYELCTIIDSMTDDDGRPLSYTNVKLVNTLKDVAYKLSKMHDLISEDKISISIEFEGVR